LTPNSTLKLRWKNWNYAGMADVVDGDSDFRKWFLDPKTWVHPEYLPSLKIDLDGPQPAPGFKPNPGFITIKMTFAFRVKVLSPGTDVASSPSDSIDGVKWRLSTGNHLGPWLGSAPKGADGPVIHPVSEANGVSVINLPTAGLNTNELIHGFCLTAYPATIYGEAGRFYDTKLPLPPSLGIYKNFADSWVELDPVRHSQLSLPSWTMVNISVRHSLTDYIKHYQYIVLENGTGGRKPQYCMKKSTMTSGVICTDEQLGF
jgi:hypothetical protein